MAFVRTRSIQTRDIGSSNVLTRAVGDAYAVDGFEPELAFDFTGETYRTDGSATTFSGAMTHSATSLGTMVDGDGAIKWRPHNLLTYSEDFTNAAWVPTYATVTANTVAAPDGTTTAGKIVGNDAVNNTHIVTHAASVTSGQTYSMSFFAKAAEKTWARFGAGNSPFGAGTYATDRSVYFDLENGVVGTVGSTFDSASISPAGNGWYLCSCVGTATATTTLNYDLSPAQDDLDADYAGLNEGIYIYGAHLYRSDLGGMVDNPDRGDSYVPTAARVLSSAPELVTNGHFNSGIDGWTDGNAEGTITWNSSGYMDLARNGGTGSGIATQSITTTSGKYYLVTFDIISISNGIKVYFGTPGSDVFTTTGTKTFVAAADASSETLRFDLLNSVTATATIDNVSVKESYIDPSVARYLPRRGHYVYNDQAWTNRGLLLESEARTNLITYSIPDTNWSPIRASVSEGVALAPDGTMTASKGVEDTSTSATHRVDFALTVTDGSSYSWSVFAKAAERDSVAMEIGAASIIVSYARFDLSSGVVAEEVGGAIGYIEDFGNGWYRCTVNGLAGVTDRVLIGICDGATQSYTGDGTSGIYLWGAQLEEDSTSSSYMPTNGATFTRAAETLTVAAADLPSTISPSGRRAALVTAGWTITDGGSV